MRWAETDDNGNKQVLDKFVGTFANGQRIEGKLYFRNGDIYTGKFADNKFDDPQGEYFFAENRDTFRGQFRDG